MGTEEDPAKPVVAGGPVGHRPQGRRNPDREEGVLLQMVRREEHAGTRKETCG
jgi:hypothetical protein